MSINEGIVDMHSIMRGIIGGFGDIHSMAGIVTRMLVRVGLVTLGWTKASIWVEAIIGKVTLGGLNDTSLDKDKEDVDEKYCLSDISVYRTMSSN